MTIGSANITCIETQCEIKEMNPNQIQNKFDWVVPVIAKFSQITWPRQPIKINAG